MCLSVVTSSSLHDHSLENRKVAIPCWRSCSRIFLAHDIFCTLNIFFQSKKMGVWKLSKVKFHPPLPISMSLLCDWIQSYYCTLVIAFKQFYYCTFPFSTIDTPNGCHTFNQNCYPLAPLFSQQLLILL